MSERIPMNSASLQEKFPAIYREFFSQCPLVVSAPGNFFWSGEYSVLYGGLGIKQNIPLRVYVGLEPGGTEIKFGSTKIFVPSKSKFEERETLAIMSDKVLNFLKQECSFLPKNRGFKINTIYEVPPGCGLAASSAFSSALAATIKIYCDKRNLPQIQQIQKMPVKNRLADSLFNEIFRLAWKLDSLFHTDSSSGAGPFASLVDSSFPIVYFSEMRSGDVSSHPGARMPINIAEDYKVIDEITVWGLRIDELVNLEGKTVLNLKSLANWPLDFGLIFTGDVGSTEAAIRSTKSLEWLHNEINPRWRKIFKNINIQGARQPLFAQLIKASPEKALEPFLMAMAAVSLETLWSLATVLAYGFSDEDYRLLFRAINRNQDLLRVLQVSAPILDEVCNAVVAEAFKGAERGTGIGGGAKLTGAGKRGDIFFVVPFHGLRDYMDNLLKKLKRTTKENIWLDYASWLDGIEEEGVKVEQSLADSIYSPFVSGGSISLKSFTKDGLAESNLSSLEDFEKERSKIDLLLDAIESDVYVKGKKLTSKEIPSAAAVEEILGILLKNIGKSILNSKLPESSYSQDRNEMQSKIVSPLSRAVKKYTGKKLPLKISGGLTDFRLKLEPSDLDIRVLNKVF